MKILLGILIAATAFSVLPARADVKLSVADAFPVGHYISVNAGDFWMKKVTELSNGEVTFDRFTAGQLGKLKELLDVTRDGVVSVAYIPMSSFTSRLPLAGVAELPGFFETSVAGTRAFNRLLKNELIKTEFARENVVPIFGAVLPPYQIASAKGSIKADADFKAIRLRTPGGILEIAAAELGAVAVPMGGPDMYSAFQRKTVDATLNSYASLNSYKLGEVVNAVSTNASFGSFAFVYAINKDQFDGLSAGQREALMQAGELAAQNLAQWMDDHETKIAEAFAAKGIATYQVEESVLANWRQRMGTVAEKWVERIESRRLPGRETLDAWQKVLLEAK